MQEIISTLLWTLGIVIVGLIAVIFFSWMKERDLKKPKADVIPINDELEFLLSLDEHERKIS